MFLSDKEKNELFDTCNFALKNDITYFTLFRITKKIDTIETHKNIQEKETQESFIRYTYGGKDDIEYMLHQYNSKKILISKNTCMKEYVVAEKLRVSLNQESAETLYMKINTKKNITLKNLSFIYQTNISYTLI